MEALILNRAFDTQAIIDSFESFIWTDRYNEPGDFEIYMPVAKAPLDVIREGYFVWIRDSDRLQIIEDITIETNTEDGDHLTITGRTLESLLERRVVYSPTTINSSLQEGLRRLLNENLINPSDSKRRMSNFRFIWNDDSEIAKLTMENTFFGETLLDIVESYCQLYDLGFKVVFNEDAGTFDFSLYYGEDRSYDQDKNPWVVFSAEYENLVGSNYFESKTGLRTAAVIASSDSEQEFNGVACGQIILDIDENPSITGIDRREEYVGTSLRWEVEEPDEQAIRDSYPNDGSYSEEFFKQKINEAWDKAIEEARERLMAQLKDEGKQKLAETYVVQSFEGEIEAVRQYVYGTDFFIGDVVQVRNAYGMEASSRISEVVRSHDVSGYTLSPTFTTLIGGANVTGD